MTLPGAERGQTERGVRIEQLAGGGGKHLGELVTVNGEVTQLFGDAAFVLGEELLVVPMPAARLEGLERGSDVRVTGPARKFDIDELERRIGVDLPNDLERYESRAAVVATVTSFAG